MPESAPESTIQKLTEELRDFESRLKSNQKNAANCKASFQPVPRFLAADIDYCTSAILALAAQLGKRVK